MKPTTILIGLVSVLVSVGWVESTHEKSIIKYLGTSFLVRFEGAWSFDYKATPDPCYKLLQNETPYLQLAHNYLR